MTRFEFSAFGWHLVKTVARYFVRVRMHRISNGHISAVADKVFPVSAKTGEGLSALKSAIHEKLVAKGYRTPFKVR